MLFTRKKQNAAAKETDESGGGAEEGGSTSGTTGKQGRKCFSVVSLGPVRRVLRCTSVIELFYLPSNLTRVM